MIRTTALIGLLGAVAFIQPALAASGDCGRSVATLADRLGISLESQADAGGATGSQRLAANNGVVKPPDTGTRDVIHPPAAHDAMPTTPTVPPQAGSDSATTPTEQGGATRLKLQSLLTAAQDAARRDDETRCEASLDAARKLAAQP